MNVEYNFDAIPPEFKQHNNWLLWKYETVNDRKTKVPYQVNGRKAKSTDPKTWCSFDDADTAFMCGDFDGVGFAIGNSGLTCVDVDHLSEWDWQKPLEPIANDCYAEMSPSGDGLHIWLKAQKPNSKCKSKSFHNSMIEVYNSDRYVTMTGANGAGEITSCQPQFDEAFKDLFYPPTSKPKTTQVSTPTALSIGDESITDMIFNENSQGRDDWIRWNAFGFMDGEDKSGADQAFINKVCFYTKDFAQIERIWMASVIGQREKTQTRPDYRERTINKALSDVDSYQPMVSDTCGFDKEPKEALVDKLAPIEIEKDADLISICKASPIARYADELAKSAKMPRNTTFLSVLSVFSSVASRYLKVEYQHGGTQPLGLNFCGQQPPGAAKSRVLASAQAPVMDLIRSKQKAIRKDIKGIKDQLDSLDDDSKKLKKAEIKELQGDLDGMFEFITDATAEALDMTLQQTNGYYSIASAEQGAINSLLGVSYTDAKSTANRDLALKGFNGEWHASKRKGRETYSGFVVGSITAIAQDGMIENLIKASDNSGVFERFIVWSEENLLGTRDHTDYHKINDFIEAQYSEAITTPYLSLSGIEYPELNQLSLSNISWKKIQLKRNEYEPTIANDGENAATILRGVVAKFDIFVMKIAANLHLSIDTNSSLIHDDRVNEAMALVDAYINHLKALIEDSAVLALSDREKSVMELIGTKKKAGKEIVNKLFRRKCFIKGGSASRITVVDCLKEMAEKNLIAYKHIDPANKKISTATFWID